jgi:hypothetical protein
MRILIHIKELYSNTAHCFNSCSYNKYWQGYGVNCIKSLAVPSQDCDRKEKRADRQVTFIILSSEACSIVTNLPFRFTPFRTQPASFSSGPERDDRTTKYCISLHVSPAFASRARAAIPAARGADADVPKTQMEFCYIQYYSSLSLLSGIKNKSEQLYALIYKLFLNFLQ